MNKILFIWGVQGVGYVPRVCWSYLRVLFLFAVYLSLHLLHLCFHQAQEETAVEPQKKVRKSGKDGVQVGFSLGLKLVCLSWRDAKLPAWIGPGFQTYVYVFWNIHVIGLESVKGTALIQLHLWSREVIAIEKLRRHTRKAIYKS